MPAMWQLWRELYLPATVALSTVAAIGYMVSHFRQGRTKFTFLDGLQIVFLMAIVAATAAPIIEAATNGAKQTALLENLYTIRSQMSLYRAQHGDTPPLLYGGTLPQLIQATSALGEAGIPGTAHPFGPYLPEGIPVNPFTDRAVITACETFPPAAASGQGGWLYHQETGQIAPDLPDMLNR
jgi:general secretion pathway protein G